ncbi:malonic semialdehyde reductase [Oharaeibacter diazotrophicus]|uniref:3-hydroxypropanoate dehydrogenase n=1 Tax=Oharaeibacter diazotrophicus TaxID=1920512 RepID=A0A4R6R9Q8_9HYPH|nr:malonic semialdehyde reductase [Oharaeibacter diazotrophicus]TDP82347.1 3-hydroxypropanoate dehydrogenase [Oharaeibacter diazotrophicus]BBE72890.1 putative malonic semialdehyde reductase RutE [Pleomorphomonas sp. SM30]
MDTLANAKAAPLDDAGLDLLFREGRTFSGFTAAPVSDDTLRTLATLAELGPTEANSLPGRFVFVKSAEAKAKLVPLMSEGNRAKTEKAPVNVIVAYDLDFFENLPKTFPQVDARAWYAGAPDERLAFSASRSTALQAGYLITAARALGLDVGPMGGYDAAAIDAAFFAGTRWRTLMVMNLGYGDRAALYPRNPRLDFDEFARIV